MDMKDCFKVDDYKSTDYSHLMKGLTKKLFCMLVLAIVGIVLSNAWAASQTHVRGYLKKNGSYVQPSFRTTPDQSRYNNWSSKPNTNPFTGQAGHVNPTSLPQAKPLR
jgi:hypothetical protein